MRDAQATSLSCVELVVGWGVNGQSRLLSCGPMPEGHGAFSVSGVSDVWVLLR